jgi:starch synthase
MRVDLLTREYPPHVYGGAGVHVTELARVLRRSIEVRVRCLDGPRDEAGVTGYSEPEVLTALHPVLGTFGADLQMAGDVGQDGGADLVHSHTWYANLAGHVASRLYGVPHVVSAHSLEPLRPWKAEQLGGGYALSSWAEKSAYEAADAIIAVSSGMRDDVLRCYPAVDPRRVSVVHNGIDLDAWRRPTGAAALDADRVVRTLGIDPTRPTVVFVGRITRQKGLPYLLRAAERLPRDVQLVLCAGAPDTPAIATEVAGLVGKLRESREGVVWIEQMLPRDELIAVLSAGTVFACPSIYEPLGIVNLEAMACSLPVVGTATGGIPEVVVAGETGLLVPIDQATDGTGTPVDPEAFVTDLAAALADAVSNPGRAKDWGVAARRRVEEHFSWDAIAERTLAVYRSVLGPEGDVDPH